MDYPIPEIVSSLLIGSFPLVALNCASFQNQSPTHGWRIGPIIPF
jgi:hypothetical protein